REDFLLDLSSYYSDLEFRHRLSPFGANDLTYGLNVRFYTDETEGSEVFHFDPADRSLMFYRGFIHDEISLIEDVLMLTLGSRFEENEQVGFNALPTARLLWSLSDRFSVWGGVSYTTGSPSRVYDDLSLNYFSFQDAESGLPVLIRTTGNDALDSEALVAYETGIWAEPSESLYLSAVAYYFRYDDVINNTMGEASILAHESGLSYLLVPFPYANELEADSVGFEIALDWSFNKTIQIGATYGFLQIDARPNDSGDLDFVEDAPKHNATLRGHFLVGYAVEADVIVRSVHELSRSDIDSYIEGDARLAWFPGGNWELSLIGRNLFDSRHSELRSSVFTMPLSYIGRSAFLEVAYKY
ncbi:MAG: TonB-dependent receptor, partial [Deltaproteobacteria bacterium]|nr:TonB-dependent receptor [Deltaproteobacteria bacterium]